MKTVTDHIRHHLLLTCGAISPVAPQPPLESMRETEWCPEFERLMRNRLIIGGMRYGLLASAGKAQWDRSHFIRQRLKLYEQTGNLEYLVDVANGALLEYVEGVHPNKHWRATDDGVHQKAKNI